MKLYGPDKLLSVLLVLPQVHEEPGSDDLELTDFAKVNLMLSALSRASLPIIVLAAAKTYPTWQWWAAEGFCKARQWQAAERSCEKGTNFSVSCATQQKLPLDLGTRTGIIPYHSSLHLSCLLTCLSPLREHNSHFENGTIYLSVPQWTWTSAYMENFDIIGQVSFQSYISR